MAKLSGQVVSVTEAGNLVTDIPISELASVPRDDSVSIQCEGHTTTGVFPTQHDQPEMTFVAFEGELGFVELTLVNDDASRFLGIKVGAPVTLKW